MSRVEKSIVVSLVILCALIGILVSQDQAVENPTLEDQFKEELRVTFGTVAIMEVTNTNQQLRVKTGLPVISDEAYRHLLMEACAILVTKPEASYEAIRFVNGIEKQGFVYKAPGECEMLIGEPDEEVKKLIFAQTEFCRGRC